MLKTYPNKMSEERYDMAEEPLNAALFTTGNGYLGIRGSFEEFGSLRIQGAYIRGLIKCCVTGNIQTEKMNL